MTSTMLPGTMKPAAADAAVTGTLTARMPGVSAAAMKPFSPFLMRRFLVIGSPAMKPRVTIAPAN